MKKSSKKKIWIFTILTIIAIVAFLFFLVFDKMNTVTFYVNKKELSSYSQKIEYNDGFILDAKTLSVSAKCNGKDCSDTLEYKKIKVEELKEYKLYFKVKNKKGDLRYKVKIVDTTAPTISGRQAYEIIQGEPFTIDNLELTYTDNYDKNIKDKVTMGTIDTTNVGEQKIIISAIDSSGNEAKYEILLKVNVKEVISLPQPIAPPQMNNPVGVANNPNDIAVLVNKQNRLPNGWAPSDLVGIGNNHYLRSEAANAWNMLHADAQNSGVNINVISSYRTQQYQQNLYNSYYASDPAGAPFYSAQARTSEHELGLAIDISYDWALHNDLQNSNVGIWMANNAHRYGFIMRYPAGKTNITQYMFEPWHYRYVGVELASALVSRGITLEEYY